MAEPVAEINRGERLNAPVTESNVRKSKNNMSQPPRRGGTMESRLEYAVSWSQACLFSDKMLVYWLQ